MTENKDPIKMLVKKKLWLLVAPLIPAFFLLIIVAAFIAIIIYPVIKGGQLVAGVAGFWDRLGNTITLKCLFCSTEDVRTKEEQKFYDKVEKLNQVYLKGAGMGGKSIQLDIPLLLSAVLYTDDIETTLGDDANSDVDNKEEVASGDLLGDLSWYYDQSDQERVDWFLGATESEGCYISKYHYYSGEQITVGKRSKLRQVAKHMVKRVIKGSCSATHDEEGNFTGWSYRDWPEYVLDIDKEDKLYTMEYDQNPYPKTREPSELETLPPAFVTYLISTYLPKYQEKYLPTEIKDLSEKHKLYLTKRKAMKNLIYSYKEGYRYLVGKIPEGSVCGVQNGNCTYTTKNEKRQTVQLSNVKIRLTQCKDGTRGEPIPGEELVDFEKYVLGVTYAENGGANKTGVQAQAVATRGFALTRALKMGGTYNLKIYQENGQWIINMRNCTEDQVYCDPDKGCTVKNGGKSATNNTVYSGTIPGKAQYKPPIPADDPIRQYVSETLGKVLVDPNGDLVYTNFTQSSGQDQWNASGKAGQDYYQALASYYGSENTLTSNCTGTEGSSQNSGNEIPYYQGDYPGVPYCSGGSTIATSGCLPTAFAMVVQSLTGKETSVQEVAEYICNDTNGARKYRVDGAGTSNQFLLDPATQSHFNVSAKEIPVSERNIDNIVNILKSGKKIIVSLKGSGLFATRNGHYIVLASVTSAGQVQVLDPGHRASTGLHSLTVIQSEVLNKVNTGMWEMSSGNGSSADGCYTGATGDFMGWRQGDPNWKDIKFGSTTIGKAGCLATSVAKLIAYSGTKVTINDFNPGTMVSYIRDHGGFSGSDWQWGAPQSTGLAPNFVHVENVMIQGLSKSQKVAKVKEYLDQGYYIVLQVKKNGTEEPGQHYVAVIGVTDTDILMSDPASDFEKVWDRYKPGGSVRLGLYRKTD